MTRDELRNGQVDQAIESIAELERKALADASLQQRTIERFVLTIGRPRTVYIVALVVLAWTLTNAILASTGRHPFDPPPFAWLTGIVSLSALLMTIVILTTENRMSEIGEARSRLHLQVSLLADRKAAKIVQLLEELRYDLPLVPNREDPEARELTLPSDPHDVASELQRRTPNRGEIPQPER